MAEKVKGTKQDKDKHCELVRWAVFSEQNKKLNAQTKLLGQEGDMLFQLKKMKEHDKNTNTIVLAFSVYPRIDII